MADYDLGRARGKVVVDYESKGQAKATQGVKTFGEGLDRLSKHADRAKDNVNQLNRSIDRLPVRKHINVTVDVNKANKGLGTLTDRLNALNRNTRVTSDGTRALSGNLLNLTGTVTGLASKIGGLGAVFSAAGAFVAGFVTDITKVSRQMTQLLKYVPAVSGAIGALSLALSGAISWVVQLASELFKLSGVLGTLPGVLGATLTVLGTLKIATSGLSGVFKELGAGIMTGTVDMEKWTEAVKTLSPSAHKVADDLRDLIPSFRQLRNLVQEAFFAPFAASIKPLIEQYLPMLSDVMQRIAHIAGVALDSLLKFLQTPEAAATIQSFLNNVVQGFQLLMDALRPLAPTFLRMMDISSSFLPQLSQLVGDLATRFSDFLNRMADSGELQDFIQTGINLFKQLIDLVTNVVSIFNTLFKIADESGAGFLQVLVDLTGQFNAWMKSAEGHEIMTNLFKALFDAGKALGPILQIIGKALLETILPTLAKLGTAMAPGLKAFFEGLATALKKLAPYLEQAAPAFNNMASALGDALVQIVEKVGPRLPELFTKMADAIIALAPHLPQLVDDLAMLAESQLFNPQTINNVARILDKLLRAAAVFTTLMSALTQLRTTLVVAFGGLWDTLSKLPTVIGFFKKAGEEAWKFGENIRKTFDNMNIGGLFSGLTQKFTEFVNGLGNWVSDMWNKGWEAGKGLFEGLKAGIRNVYNSLPAVVKKAVDIIIDYLPGSPAKKGPLAGQGWTYYRGQRMIVDLGRGMESQAGFVAKATIHVTGGIGRQLDTSYKTWITDIEQLSGFGKHILSFIESLGDIAFSVISVVSSIIEATGYKSPKAYRKLWTAEPGVYHGVRPAPQTKGHGATVTPTYTPTAAAGIGKPPRQQRGWWAGAVATPPKLTANATPEDLQQAIIARGRAEGLSNAEIAGIMALAQAESNWGVTGFLGFQQPPMNRNPQAALDRFFENYKAGGFGAGGPTQQEALAALGRGDVEPYLNYLKYRQQGIPAGSTNAGDMAYLENLRRYYGQWLPRVQGTTGGTGNARGIRAQPAATTRLPGRGMNYTPASMKQLGIKPLYEPGTTEIPSWAQYLAKQFDLSISTYGYGGTLHEGGFAFDVGFGGSQAGRERFAQWVMNNALPQTVQLIYQSPTRDYEIAGGEVAPGYYGTTTMAAHADHVHIAFAGPVNLDTTGWQPTPWGTQDTQSTLDHIDQNTSDTADNTRVGMGLPQYLEDLRRQDSYFNDIVSASQGTYQLTDDQVVPALEYLDNLIAEQNNLNTPASKANIAALEGIRSDVMSTYGYAENEGLDWQSSVDMVQNIAQGAVGMAQDVFGIIDATLKSIAGAKDLADILVRGIGNTEDIYNIIESIQPFLELAQRVASAVGDALSFAAGIVGGVGAGTAAAGDMGATQLASMALGAAGSIAQIVASTISAINAGIDLVQEAYRIGTKYLGRFMMQWLGFGGYQGRVRYLLDTMTGELKVWQAENPEMKQTFGTLGKMLGVEYPGRPEAPSNIFYIYQGPGQDPRDTMSDAMFAVKASGVGVFGYGA